MEDIIKQLLSGQEGVLSESAQTQLSEAIATKVDELATEKTEIALQEQDEDHFQKLQKLIEHHEIDKTSALTKLEESIDEQYTVRAKEVFEKLDKNYTEKLVQVKEHYESQINNDIGSEVKNLSESLDMFLESHLDKIIPDDLQELLGKISNIIPTKDLTSDTRDAIVEAKEIIDKQNLVIEGFQKKEFLEENTKHLPIEQKKFVLKNLLKEGNDLDFVKRNLSYVTELFTKKEEDQARVVVEKSSPTVVNQKTVLNESVDSKAVLDGKRAETNPVMAGWVNDVKKAGKIF